VSDVQGLAWIARRMLGRAEGDDGPDAALAGTPG
jgi:hypothetical protein